MVLVFGWMFIVDHRVTLLEKKADQLLAERQTEVAEDIYREIEKVEPWRELNWTLLSEQYLSQGKIDKAIQILEPLADNQFLDPDGWSILARAYQRINQNDRVEPALLEAYRLSETENEKISTLQNLVSYHRSKNDFKQALYFQQKITKLPSSSDAAKIDEILLRAVVDPELGLFDNNSLNSKPKWMIDWQTGFINALSHPQQDLKWVQIGRTFALAGYWDLAEFSFSRSIELRPNYGEAWGLLAEARQQQGKDGRSQIEKALTLSPDSPGIRLAGALFYRRQKDYNKAIDLMEQNIASQPDEMIWKMELARTFADAGRLEDAVEIYGQAITQKPEDVNILIALTRFCVQYAYRLEDLALPAAQRAIELNPASTQGHDVLGQVYFSLGEEDKADEAFSIAQSLDPDYAPLWLHIGQFALDAGDSIRAREALLKAVDLAADSQEGKLASRLLKQYFNFPSDSQID